MELDWHADRAVSLELLQIDTDGHDIDIDMEQVRTLPAGHTAADDSS